MIALGLLFVYVIVKAVRLKSAGKLASATSPYALASPYFLFAGLTVMTAIDCWLTPDRSSVWWEPIGLGTVTLLFGISVYVWPRGGN
jgi:hypothetical protein